MRILLDECLPRQLLREIREHEIMTVPELGWSGLKNGELLSRAVNTLFLTMDKNLPSQQKLTTYAIAVVVLRCPTNDINDLKNLVPAILAKPPGAQKGEASIIG